MKYTTNYNLKKPDETDFYSVEHANANMDAIDAALNAEAAAREEADAALPIKSMGGKSVSPSKGSTVTAGTGATIVGNVEDRAYSETGALATSGNVASGENAIVVGGDKNTAQGTGDGVFAGLNNTTGGNSMNPCSVILGGISNKTEKGAYTAILAGSGNSITGPSTMRSAIIAGNQNAISSGMSNSVIIGGSGNTIAGNSAIVGGYTNSALTYQLKYGHYAKDGTGGTYNGTTGDAFIIGNGVSDTNRANAFRVTYAGQVYALAAYQSTGADYAEYFEWEDGNPNNEDRCGLLVVLSGEKIRLAQGGDVDILGVVSAAPCILGDSQFDDWHGKYMTDIFGRRLTQTTHRDAEYEVRESTDPETGKVKKERICVTEECDTVTWVLNPDYDPEKEYISRADRKEWSAVGMMGKLILIDDGSCVPNGYAVPGVNGIATSAEGRSGYRVLSRMDDTHIKVLVR